MATKTAPTLADIESARERIGSHARVTPVYGSATLSRETGRDVTLKAENLQRTGSFKIRGAMNTLATLSPEERAAGAVAPRAGGRMGGAGARHPRDDLHASGRADGEGRADGRLRRRGGARRHRLRGGT